jgi:hypothetical protein
VLGPGIGSEERKRKTWVLPHVRLFLTSQEKDAYFQRHFSTVALS